MKIISYNILEGMAADPTPDKRNFIEWVRIQNADIMALQEANRFTQESLDRLASRPTGILMLSYPKKRAIPSPSPPAIRSNNHTSYVNR